MLANQGTDSMTSKKPMGRPMGAKSKVNEEVEKELIETKCKLAEVSLENLKLKILSTTNPAERNKLKAALDEIVSLIEGTSTTD